MWGCWHRSVSCCQEAACGEVVGVGEAVGGASQDLEQVVGALDSAVGGAVGVVEGEDLCGPGDDGVDGVVELGQFCGLVEVAESPEGVEGALAVVCEVEAVQFLQGLPAGFEPGVGAQQGVEAGPVCVVELVASAHQQEPGTEHVRGRRRV